MRNRNVVPIDCVEMVSVRRHRHVRFLMSNDLMTEQVEINPAHVAATF